MTKFKLFFDIEKEEAWLDKMAADGYKLTKVSPSISRYTFEKMPDGKKAPSVRIDYGRNKGLRHLL